MIQIQERGACKSNYRSFALMFVCCFGIINKAAKNRLYKDKFNILARISIFTSTPRFQIPQSFYESRVFKSTRERFATHDNILSGRPSFYLFPSRSAKPELLQKIIATKINLFHFLIHKKSNNIEQ